MCNCFVYRIDEIERIEIGLDLLLEATVTKNGPSHVFARSHYNNLRPHSALDIFTHGQLVKTNEEKDLAGQVSALGVSLQAVS